MRKWLFIYLLILVVAARGGKAQAIPSAYQNVRLSLFALGTSTSAAIESTHNVGITAGLDVSIAPKTFTRFLPAIEVRGTMPFEDGQTSDLRSALAGIRIERFYNKVHPYANFLIGRGRVQYLHGGYIYGDRIYLSSITIDYSPGGGIDYDLTRVWGVKADLQYQFWSVPVVTSGSIHPIAVSAGVIYRFGTNNRID